MQTLQDAFSVGYMGPATINNPLIYPTTYFMLSGYPVDRKNTPGFVSIKSLEKGRVEFQFTPDLLYADFNYFALTKNVDIPANQTKYPKLVAKGTATLENGTATINWSGKGKLYCSYKTPSNCPGFIFYLDQNTLKSTSKFDDGVVNWVVIDDYDKPTGCTIIPGTATLQNGHVDVPYPDMTDQAIVLIARRGLSGIPGFLALPSVTPGVGFSISSDQRTDSGSVDWFVFP